jgi:hypothetical protein
VSKQSNRTEEGKKQRRKQIPVNLNLEDPRELKMYEWYSSQTTNVSGMLKNIAYEYMERKIEQEKVNQQYQLLQGGEIKVEVTQSQQTEPKKKRRLGSIPGVD